MSLTHRRALQVWWSVFSVAIISACGAPGSTSALPGSKSDSPQTSSLTFRFTHEPQRFKVPSGVTQLTITADGAMGGGYSKPKDGNPGGLGAKVKATIPVMSGQVLIINVGGRGIRNQHSGGGGGYNGGGAAGEDAFGGGGSSDVRTAKDGLADRLVVAGGGGGSGETGEESSCSGSSCSYSSGFYELLFGGTGGVGGATTGGRGGTGADGGGGGAGASQTHGGAGGAGLRGSSSSFSSHYGCKAIDGSKGNLFNGGAGASDSCGPAGGGGGGGYYGGGGGGGGGYDDNVATGSISYESGGGGGGGGGTSFVEKSGSDIHKTSGGAPHGDGEITIAW